MFQIVISEEELARELQDLADYLPLKVEELEVGIPHPARPMPSHLCVNWFALPLPGIH